MTRLSLPLRSANGAKSLFLYRRPADWRNKPPSRTAFADWLQASRPAVEEAYEEKAERDSKPIAAEPGVADAVELAEAAE